MDSTDDVEANGQVQAVFLPSGRRGSFPIGTPLVTAARRLGVDLDSVCGGRGLCGRCQVRCVTGAFPKHGIQSDQSHLSALTATEIKYSQRKGPLPDDVRLGCHTELMGDVVIDVPPESQLHRQIVRKEAEYRDIHLDTATRLYYVEVPEPTLDQAISEQALLQQALTDEWGLPALTMPGSMAPTLQAALAGGDRGVTVAVFQSKEMIGLWPGLFDRPRGVAIDVGSTTVAAHLCDLNTGEVIATAGVMNPQIRFGEDLMSRVSYVMMEPKGAEHMTAAIRECLNELLQSLSQELDGVVSDILEITLVANPIMHHLVLGINPINLGGAPFALTIDSACTLRAADIGITIQAEGKVYTLPCIAGHVGADAAGVILAEQPYEQDELSLLVDVGTNAEIVMGNSKRLLACSSPTGPAFEGAQISSGQRATVGAIERVRIDPITLEPNIKIIGSELWSAEPDFELAIADTGVTGICGSGIIEVIAEMFLAGIVSADGVINGALADKTPRIRQQGRTWCYVLDTPSRDDPRHEVIITQNDIRQIQLAKAALYAGIKLLMDELGVTNVDRIRLAGAFGSHISVTHAMVLGLIPDCPLENVSPAGNAASMGARIALLDQTARPAIERVVTNIERVETATADAFQHYFVEAMAFPHNSESFPNLFEVVHRPVVRELALAQTNKRRRRRTH